MSSTSKQIQDSLAHLTKRGYQPTELFKGYVPNVPNMQGGYQPATSQAAPPTPPNKGTSGKKS